MSITFIFRDKFIKLVARNKIYDLREYVLSNIHNLAGLGCKITLTISNQKIKERSETLINKGIYEV